MDISTERWRVRAWYRSESEQGAHFSVTPNTAKPHSTIRLSVFAPRFRSFRSGRSTIFTPIPCKKTPSQSILRHDLKLGNGGLLSGSGTGGTAVPPPFLQTMLLVDSSANQQDSVWGDGCEINGFRR
ncbi:hypothetical protein F511_14765 [Dorcoceras hygrometricum]|uniref:Uncharacterized protein n=1 Tax=Dorcoceras hygrometricum TaxID=472368 RepID=A0A2Z7BKY5_9LAMI|nr:hypothetical protein F511_14765 [Dorcoceras hygrometricum]